jgi:glutathione S-transferase
VILMSGPGRPTPEIAERSPSGRVPLLEHDGLLLWDSLAIAEYVAELAPESGLWPEDRRARAVARSVCAEMHSGFAALRSALPMNVRRRKGVPLSPEVRAEIARILTIWRDCRYRFGGVGAFLFGRFSIADAAFAPVICRFVGYEVELDADCRSYANAVLDHASMKQWIAAANAEPWSIAEYDAV